MPIEEEILVIFVFEKNFLLPSRYQQEKLEYHIMHLPAPKTHIPSLPEAQTPRETEK